MTVRRHLRYVITPAIIYLKAVVPAKAGIQNWPGCRIRMKIDMFNCRGNNKTIIQFPGLKDAFSH